MQPLLRTVAGFPVLLVIKLAGLDGGGGTADCERDVANVTVELSCEKLQGESLLRLNQATKMDSPWGYIPVHRASVPGLRGIRHSGTA